ncbi:MAG: HAD-IIIA family hydrolase [Phycisphaeraceae bacterium]|nr:HAD-IIIA family hydrolase [Phycisphaeraceae bacterium]
MRRAVFLDRDGTLVDNDADLGDAAGVRLLAEVARGCALLCTAGWALVVVTNQGGVARGAYDEAAVDRVHAELERQLCEATGLPRVLDAFYHCPFHPEGVVPRYRREHPWRKPAPGMLLAAARDLDLDLAQCWMVGDAERDVLAGRSAGARTIRVADDPSSIRATTAADFVDRTLIDAAKRIDAASRADLRPRSTVRLRAKSDHALIDPTLRESVLSAARALAERTGVEVAHLAATPAGLEATLVGEEVIAVGFAAELRRTTEAWFRARTGETLWGER